MPRDLDLYPYVETKEFETKDAEFQAKVGYKAYFNHLQDYKIYGTMIKMFFQKFLNNL
jgi:hypothetical protein